jgi:putative ABC transport system permease protein
MIRSYLKIAWRNLLKHRVFTIINTLGLSIGMIACLLILQFVRYEQNYDKISPATPQLWRAFNETVTNGIVTTKDGNTHPILGPSLKADLPEVSDYFRMYNRNTNEVVFYQNNQALRIKHAWMTDPGFLRLFPQQFISGNASACLLEPWKMILTESAARQLFPDGNAMGKTLQVPGGPFSGTYEVEGIIVDPPLNTHLKFNVLTSYATRYAKGHKDGWDSYWDYNYFQLTPDADIEKVQSQLDKYSEEHLKSSGIRLAMQPFESIHLHSNLTYEIEPNGSARVVYFLGLVALLIFAIGCINYINMTTARSLERAKEIGLRKVVGARRGQLIGQFLLEGFLLNGMAMVIALMGLQMLLPVFGQFVGRPLEEQGFDAIFWMQAGGLFLAGITVACSYPALVLTRFAPLDVLGGHTDSAFKGRGSWGLFFRKALVVFQFSCSAALIFGLTVVNRQLNFLQNHDKGLSLDQIITLKMPETDWQQDSLNRIKIGRFKNQIAQISGISSISSSSIVPSLGIQSISGTSSGLVLANKPSEALPGTIYFVDATPGFYETFGIRFLAGKPYVTTDERLGNQHVIVNEALLQMLGIASPEAAIGLELAYPGSTDGHKMKIEGVVVNFHIESLKAPARPTLYFSPPELRNGFISLKINTGEVQSLLASLELAWKNTYPESPFEYWFLDEQFASQYVAETRLGKVFALFAGLAVFIACLGLFGLAKFTAEQRTKEIGIRKVLGASVTGIVAMLSKEFTKLVIIAAVISFPIAWWAMNSWLLEFAYRINISWWVFLISGLSAILIAFAAVSYQAIKAAVANPVKSLRTQ